MSKLDNQCSYAAKTHLCAKCDEKLEFIDDWHLWRCPKCHWSITYYALEQVIEILNQEE